MLTSASIKDRAVRCGFDLCGIAPAAAFPELAFLADWIDRGYAGEMHYMRRTAARRADVRHVLPSARSVIAVAVVYNTNRPYSIESADRRPARVARYAWGDDYHDVLGRRLGALIAWMREAHGEPFEARAYVDTGPVQERLHAQYAGLGWIGKNTCLISPELGSWLFLAEILTSLELEPDAPGLDRCGTCTLCLDACPTAAIVEPYVLDATRCLSYLTIEVREAMPEEHRDKVGAHVFGCDICQEVCPWNAAPATSQAPEWQPRSALDRPGVIDLWRASDRSLQSAIRATALTRAGVRRLRRNVAVALGNSDDPEAAGVLEAETGTDDPSRADAMVREHVAWARRKLLGET